MFSTVIGRFAYCLHLTVFVSIFLYGQRQRTNPKKKTRAQIDEILDDFLIYKKFDSRANEYDIILLFFINNTTIDILSICACLI